MWSVNDSKGTVPFERCIDGEVQRLWSCDLIMILRVPFERCIDGELQRLTLKQTTNKPLQAARKYRRAKLISFLRMNVATAYDLCLKQAFTTKQIYCSRREDWWQALKTLFRPIAFIIKVMHIFIYLHISRKGDERQDWLHHFRQQGKKRWCRAP